MFICHKIYCKLANNNYCKNLDGQFDQFVHVLVTSHVTQVVSYDVRPAYNHVVH